MTEDKDGNADGHERVNDGEVGEAHKNGTDEDDCPAEDVF